MMRQSLAALLLTVLLPGAALSQTDRALSELRTASEAAARGDTTLALAHIDRAISLQPSLAEAHWRRAEIFIRRTTLKATDYEARSEAQHSLEDALHYDPGNALYMVELGKIMLKQQVRQDARRVFGRAVKAADRSDPLTRAEAHFQLALYYEARWLRFRDRRLLPGEFARFATEVAYYNPRYAWRILTESVPVSEDQSAGDRNQLVEHLRTALRANPRHTGAATHLLAYYLDRDNLNDYMQVAERFAGAAPDLADATLALALGLYRRGATEDAQRLFDRALAQMDATRARSMRSLARILARKKATFYEELPDSARNDYERRFWSTADPLFSTPQNEFWLEYMARVAYADIRFGIPEYEVRGWQTDPGLTWIRYGPPVRKATFAPNASDVGDWESIARITTVWSYGEQGPVFVFRQTAGFRRVDFAEDFEQYADDYRAVQPARLVSDAMPDLTTLPAQLAQFRGSNGETILEVHAAAPADAFEGHSSDAYRIGLFIQTDRDGQILRHERVESATSKEPVSWRVNLHETAPVTVAVEEYDSAAHRAATLRREITPRAFRLPVLQLSDLLLASSIQATTPQPLTRGDYDIRVNPAALFTPHDHIGIYFEVYGLTGVQGLGEYQAEMIVTIKELARSGGLRRALGDLADRWGLTREGENIAQVKFQKESRISARDVVSDHFLVQLPPNPPAGLYAIKLTVTDRASNQIAVAQREFRISQ